MTGPGGGDRLGGLRRVKLRALVAQHWYGGGVSGGASVIRSDLRAPGDWVDSGLPGGAALADGSGRVGWVLLDDGNPAALGGALAWRRSHPCGQLHVLVEDRGRQAAGIIARRAALFADPPTVWRVEDRTVAPAVPLVASGESALRTGSAESAESAEFDRAAGGMPAAVLDRLSAQIFAHGAVPMLEHGVLRAEVLGLEVARAVPADPADPAGLADSAAEAGGWRLAVGVGRHDREARQELRPGEPVDAALDDIVALVRRWRTAGDRRHPANTLARERLLRAAVVADPGLAGAVTLAPVASPLPVDDLRSAAAAGAVGVDGSGGAVVVVCSTGIDIDLVPTAADFRLLYASDARLVLVMPAIDAYPLTRALAASLRVPADVRTVEPGWERIVV